MIQHQDWTYTRILHPNNSPLHPNNSPIREPLNPNHIKPIPKPELLNYTNPILKLLLSSFSPLLSSSFFKIEDYASIYRKKTRSFSNTLRRSFSNTLHEASPTNFTKLLLHTSRSFSNTVHQASRTSKVRWPRSWLGLRARSRSKNKVVTSSFLIKSQPLQTIGQLKLSLWSSESSYNPLEK